ncbi:ubiquitin-protein ligase E3A [Protomyces lactucae-debilis]|uniref:HECT-type E3 ubiquitin transferase n=1 Tax=Protomyces lactucae-debilis TaxID=2754530 RepID=A0A1Y2FB93_PROLT|nr:ubiquitin-protein ligase E3A [Protomyces lactucae-debilis]ORY80897.1 ubiquitin-protein ligase E3A [Protomyces lactucae-debilis]
MALFFSANAIRVQLPVSRFYNPLTDYIDFDNDYSAWKNRQDRFAFCQYPFWITLKQKQRILAVDAYRQQRLKVREAYFASLDSGKDASAIFELNIRREHLMEDSLREIPAHEDDLKKKLVVTFQGEEGVDAGGLRKEFFLLLCRQLFDTSFGLFIRDEQSNFCWFNPESAGQSSEFFLLGVVLGLAIYNSTILDVQLPPVLFKKLVGQNCTLADLKVLHPQLWHGLQQLLDYKGDDLEETFCRTFVIERQVGTSKILKTIPLCPNGEDVLVKQSNKREFVSRYCRYILEECCQRQMFHLSRGFHQVAGGNALSLLRAEEIELLVRGSPDALNLDDLKAVCNYEGFPLASKDPLSEPIIIWFWQCFESLDPMQQRALLSFITGSDRIPATGTVDLKFRISVDRYRSSQMLPVAHTCFSQIILPQYESLAETQDKIRLAIREGNVGFTIA